MCEAGLELGKLNFAGVLPRCRSPESHVGDVEVVRGRSRAPKVFKSVKLQRKLAEWLALQQAEEVDVEEESEVQEEFVRSEAVAFSSQDLLLRDKEFLWFH